MSFLRYLAPLTITVGLGVAVACGSSTTDTGPVVCCPRPGGGSCAGGGSKRLQGGNCPTICDCLHVTGVTKDADGCEVDVYVSEFPSCQSGRADTGVDAPADAPIDAPDGAIDAAADSPADVSAQ